MTPSATHQPSPIAHHSRADELSTRQAVDVLGRNVRSIRRAIERGELVPVRRGSSYRIAIDDLMRYAARGGPRSVSPPRGRIIALPAVTHGATPLPQPLSPFIGRDAEVAGSLPC